MGVPCGGSVLTHDGNVYRSFNGGLSLIDVNLNLEESVIGDYNQSDIYHIEKINNNVKAINKKNHVGYKKV